MSEQPYPFWIEPHDYADKSFRIHGPDDLDMDVDYDDVNHEEVDALAIEVVAALNRHWKLNH